nr:MAG TPA: D-xylulose 5-phosphate/D-fructose 6-phosphate phosphoketolase [Caudoviricetes sp.]
MKEKNIEQMFCKGLIFSPNSYIILLRTNRTNVRIFCPDFVDTITKEAIS